MSHPRLASVPDPTDVVVAALHAKLVRLFAGIKVKELDVDCGPLVDGRQLTGSVRLKLIGPEALLLQYGLLTPTLLSSVPRCGVKYFRTCPKDAGHWHMKRGKTGTNLSFYWNLRESPEELKNAPLWIRSELMRLFQIRSDAAMAEKPKPAPPQVKKTPEQEWQSRAKCALYVISGLIPDAEGLVDEESILANDSPMKKHEGAMDLVAVHLKRILNESISAPESAPVQSYRHLRLVVDNTNPVQS